MSTPARTRCPRELPIALVVAMLSACGSPAAPSSSDLNRALPGEMTTPHYVFRFSQGDSVDANRQEPYHEWVVARLGVSLDRRITYYKYRDRAHMSGVTGQDTNGWADPPAFAVHTIWPWDNHEVVHVMTALFGRPTDFFNEGIAVAMSVDLQSGGLDPMWQGRTVHTWAATFRATGLLPRIANIVETGAFRELDANRSYPIAGSFVFFLIESRGMEQTRQFFRTGSRDSRRSDVEGQFSAAFQLTLGEAETQWLDFVARKIAA